MYSYTSPRWPTFQNQPLFTDKVHLIFFNFLQFLVSVFSVWRAKQSQFLWLSTNLPLFHAVCSVSDQWHVAKHSIFIPSSFGQILQSVLCTDPNLEELTESEQVLSCKTNAEAVVETNGDWFAIFCFTGWRGHWCYMPLKSRNITCAVSFTVLFVKYGYQPLKKITSGAFLLKFEFLGKVKSQFIIIIIIIIIIYFLTVRVVGAPQMISQPISSIFFLWYSKTCLISAYRNLWTQRHFSI